MLRKGVGIVERISGPLSLSPHRDLRLCVVIVVESGDNKSQME